MEAFKKERLRCEKNSKEKIAEKGKIDSPNVQIHDRSLSWLGTATTIKSGRVKVD